MPTIVFVSPKGGAGKTTAALLLATQLADSYDVTVIDADPNRPIGAWASGGHVPERLTVVSEVDEENIIDQIEAAAEKTPIVIVDLEGTAAKIVVLAVSQADPGGDSDSGLAAGRRAGQPRDQGDQQREKMTGRALPYAVLLTRTNPAIRTRTMSHIQQGLIDAGIPVMETELHDREAFRAVFSFRRTLKGLDAGEVANLDKAQANVEQYALEIVRGLAAAGQAAKKGRAVA